MGWRAVLSHSPAGRYWYDLNEAERDEIRHQCHGVSDAMLAVVKWEKRWR